jgi:hypothetical protein
MHTDYRAPAMLAEHTISYARARSVLADTLAPWDIGDDLDFFFFRAESEMALRSSWETFAELARSGVRGGKWSPDPMSERRIEAGWRASRVRRALLRMPHGELMTLMHGYDDRRWPDGCAAVFGRWTGIAVRTSTFLARANGEPHARLVELLRTGRRSHIEAIGAEGLALLTSAWEAYGHVVGRRRSRFERPIEVRRAA